MKWVYVLFVIKRLLEGVYDMENEKNIRITRKEEIDFIHKDEHPLYEYYKYKIPKVFHGSKLDIAFYEIPPKKSGYPYHYHLKNEEVFYIISGTGKLRSGKIEREISSGDVIVCPPGEDGAHMITNISTTESLVYFEVDLSYDPDVIKYPDMNKVGIISENGDKMFFKENMGVDYYE